MKALSAATRALRISWANGPGVSLRFTPRLYANVRSAKNLDSSKTTRGAVEKLLTAKLQSGAASADEIARQLGVSRQTLFRRLKAEGVTFEKVLDELRHRMALKYLNDQKLSVNETAYLVRFSDPAAFSHAFKRWTGHSPATIRKRKA